MRCALMASALEIHLTTGVVSSSDGGYDIIADSASLLYAMGERGHQFISHIAALCRG